MTEGRHGQEHRPRELTVEELEAQEIAALPDREALSMIGGSPAAPVESTVVASVLSNDAPTDAATLDVEGLGSA